MPIEPVLLWTDLLIYLLLLVVGLYAWQARRRPHLATPWRRLARRPAAMAAAVILAAFVLVGLADSVHLRLPLPEQAPGAPRQYAPETLSLLDLALKPLRDQKEKTYSAPFATHLYAMETVEEPDGRIKRLYPRLRYGGAHLGEDLERRTADIMHRALRGTLTALLVWLAILTLVAWRLKGRESGGLAEAGRRLLRGETELPWRTMLVTLGVILWLASLAAHWVPAWHIFGTDKVGQDVFYLSLKSIRTGLVIGTLTTLVMLPFALALGIMAGYFRGWVDDVIQYLYTTLNSIPGVLLIAAAVLVLQVRMDQLPELTLVERADLRLLFLCMILGITSWTGLCRLLRAETLKLREMEFIEAAQAFGVGPARIMLRHVLPNVMHIVLITITLEFSGLVLAEAVLAYVGVGVDPSMQSWGNMINGARLELAREPVVWWLLAAAFAFMFVLVLAANVFADAVRDAFDPRVE
ncbi:ABC transporter permease [Thiobacter aerophilum]|uniref:ABC transporter permease n=1 Tax=Thiobacter aerophilum TaxID=3121275 RepID=A0ABV0EBF5_9BURK